MLLDIVKIIPFFRPRILEVLKNGQHNFKNNDTIDTFNQNPAVMQFMGGVESGALSFRATVMSHD